ncbi:signal peptidase complex-like protein DTM1 isoform X1 [Cucurbita maxima]|uniref:Signal peptidase complex-like protein DTM1 isoform X1 n=1 Tax=Cucurbita maxima TaxID=3661 RepID=A0A6J1J358_CUCMA|nr:signal peptidase complex-like protein DTM1 isoform X1 [Cucurbita maxima]
MAEDAALKSSLVFLAATVVLVGISTHSFKKMAVTYLVGVFAIAGILLPDWCFFDRDFSRWISPVTEEERESYRISTASRNPRFRIYPIRLAVYATVYSAALYKWWKFVST